MTSKSPDINFIEIILFFVDLIIIAETFKAKLIKTGNDIIREREKTHRVH